MMGVEEVGRFLMTRCCKSMMLTWTVLLVLNRWVAAQGLPPNLYWSDRVANTIRRADADGTNSEVLVSGIGQARGVAVDFENDLIYWADNGANKIQRSNLDGTNIVDLVTTGLRFPAGIDLDVEGGKMYWADRDQQVIQRANLDGSNVEDIVEGLSRPYYVRLDLINDQIYWTDFGTDKIQRSELDGSNVTDLVTTGLVLPRGIDLDLDAGKMYWADRGTDKIQRSNLDGTNIETLHTVIPPAGVDAAPHGVAIDSLNGHLYWLDNGTVKLQRSNLDGSNVVDILDESSGLLTKPWEIVLEERFDECAIVDCNPVDHGLAIDAITSHILESTFDDRYDLVADGQIDQRDRQAYIETVANIPVGDSNGDGYFNSSDLVTVFSAGEFEDNLVQNSRWATGDWNGDFEFRSNDFVHAFSFGSYENAAQSTSVPEPRSRWLLLVGIVWLDRLRR